LRRWLTSDHHFGHQNILKYCEATRPFSSVDEMHVGLIAGWNESIAPDDEVIVVGDFIASSRLPHETAIGIMRMLNGRKTLVKGNHDPATWLFRAGGFQDVVSRIWMPEERVLIIHKGPDPKYAPAEMRIAGEHDPLLVIHGHDHRHDVPDRPGCLNVCVDRWGMKPVPWDEAVRRLQGATPWNLLQTAGEGRGDTTNNG